MRLLWTAAGIKVPGTMRGKPLQELVKRSFQGWREEVFLQISESQVGRAIRKKKWKYSVYAPDKDGRNDSEGDLYAEQYLYDLDNDPNELNNLVSDPAYEKVRSELAERLKRQMVEAGEKEPVIKSSP
jgi:uncharacterized sulfatase